MHSYFRCFLLVPLLMIAACATNIQPSVSVNPPPSEAFKAFGKFQLEPVQLSANEMSDKASAKANAKIEGNMQDKLAPILARWDEQNDGDRLLIIEPTVEDMKFVNATKRVFVGGFAGSSAVRMTIRFVDGQTGEVIAQPEFYQHANGTGGAWTYGGTDNAMLVRIATVVQEYLLRNYEQPVGGPTGLESAQKG